MSMISHEISWWDIFVVQVSMLCQWYLTKLVGEIFLGTNDACDTSESVIDVFRISNQSILVIPVSQVIPVIPVSQVSLAHLWVLFGVIFINLSMAKRSQMLNAFDKQQEWRFGIRHDQPDVWRRCLKYFLEDNWHDKTRCRKCVQQKTFNIIWCGDIWGFERRQNVAFRGRVKSLLTNHQKYSCWKQCDSLMHHWWITDEC